jgi:integrase
MIRDPQRKNITFNPVTLVPKEEERNRESVLSNDQISKILETIDSLDKRYSHLKDIVVIGLNTGMRIGEILKMKKDPKEVTINFVIKPILTRLLKENKRSLYVLTNPKRGSHYTTIQNSWNSVLEKTGLNMGRVAGVSKFRAHDMRHTAASRLAESGVSISIIAKYLGHLNERTSFRCIHPSNEKMAEVSNVLGKNLFAPTVVTTPEDNP